MSAVAVGQLGRTHDVIVSGGSATARCGSGTATGTPVGDPLTGHTGGVTAVAVGRLGDRDVIVSGSDDGTVRIWDPPPAPRSATRSPATPAG